jgi:tape measure domain-containing protein
MRIALGGVVPDQESYNTALEKVSTISDKYALSQRTILKGFTQLQASAVAAGFSVDDTGKLMEGLLARTLASGKGIEEFKGVMLAASQILSKNKLMAEEARGQIGERIPGFMADLANSMNISTKELDKRMEQGKVTLEDFFKLGEDLLKNNEDIAKMMAKSYANAGARLAKATEDLQISVGGQWMILGAKIQNIATAIVKSITFITDAFKNMQVKQLESLLTLPNWALAGLGGRDKLEEELRILSGKQKIPTKEEKKKLETETQELLKQAEAWKKIEERLKIDTQFQENRISLGEKEAEIQRELAELRLQFGPEKDLDEIEKKIRALKELEDQTISNSVAFKELQEEAAKNLKELSNPMNQLRVITETFEESFSSAIQEVVKGTKSIGDAVTSMLRRIADAMLQNAADVMASQANNWLLKVIAPAVQSMFGGVPTNTTTPSTTVASGSFGSGSYASPSQIIGRDNNFYGNTFPKGSFASGGYVDRPTNALIGENSEGEYIIPESKLASSLSRFQAGHRGSSVVPGGVGNSGGSGGGSGEVTVNYTGPTLNFNGDEYVPRSAVPQIINSAAMAGATAGRANTMKDLKNSRSQRSRLGL